MLQYGQHGQQVFSGLGGCLSAQKKAPRTANRTGCHNTESGKLRSLGQDHSIDDVDDAVAGLDVGLGHV